MKIKNLVIAALAFPTLCCFANKKPLVDYANLLLGTDMFLYPEYAGNNSLDPDFGLYANEIVGPRMPDGIVSPSPLTSFRGVAFHARGAGYRHSDKYIIGLRTGKKLVFKMSPSPSAK